MPISESERPVLRAQGQRRAARQRHHQPAAEHRPRRGAPDVTFGFSGKGKNAFQNVTAQIAHRGEPRQRPRPDAQPALRGRARQPADHGPVRSTTSSTPTGSTATTAPTSPAASRSARPRTSPTQLRLGALPIKLKLISESQVSATLGKQALHQGLIAGLIGLLVVAIFLLAYYRVLGADRGRRAARLRPLLLRADQADPDHADAAGHRGPDPDDRRRRGREHRDLRARQGGDPRRALDPAGDRHRLPKGLTAIIDANVVTIMTAFILFVLATADVQGFAFTLGIGTFVSLFTAVMATQAILTHDGQLAADLAARRRSARAARSAPGGSTSWAPRGTSSRCRA